MARKLLELFTFNRPRTVSLTIARQQIFGEDAFNVLFKDDIAQILKMTTVFGKFESKGRGGLRGGHGEIR